MSSRLRWMPDWLTGPSLGQYMKIRPGDSTQHANLTGGKEVNGGEFSSTKQLLKKHMVDSFFERALHQIQPELSEQNAGDDSLPADLGVEVSPQVDGLDDVVSEPIFEEELPLDDSFLFVEQEEYANKLPEGEPQASTDAFTDEMLREAFVAVKNGEQQPEKATLVEVEEHVGYYVFAITLGQFEFKLPAMRMEEAYPLFVYSFGKSQAVISKVPLGIYSDEALQARLNDPSWFEKTLRKHNQVLGGIQAQTSIVPMRVCTICDSMEALKSFLNEHHDDFVSTLELIEGNRSWRFSIFCNEPRLRSLTAQASNRVRAIQAELAGKSADDAGSLQQKLESVLEEEARSVCKACVKHSHGTLSGMASKNKIQSIAEEQAGDPQRREIFRCDYMVSLMQADAFKKEIGVLVEAYKSLGFELEVEGPQTPDQFASRKVLPVRVDNDKKSGVVAI